MSGTSDTAGASGTRAVNGLLVGIAVLGMVASGLIGAELTSRQQQHARLQTGVPDAAASARILVLDPTPWVREIAGDPTLSDEDRLLRSQELSGALARAIERELAAGAIILNANAVHAAPEAAYVRP